MKIFGWIACRLPFGLSTHDWSTPFMDNDHSVPDHLRPYPGMSKYAARQHFAELNKMTCRRCGVEMQESIDFRNTFR